MVEKFYQRNRDVGLSLVIQDMDYAYFNGNQIFERTDFCARPHEIVALVGPSGEGKTTLLRLILALLEPQKGSLEIYGEGRDDKVAYSPSVRQLFSYVPQGNTMFSGTVAENMRNVKPDASEEEIANMRENSYQLWQERFDSERNYKAFVKNLKESI